MFFIGIGPRTSIVENPAARDQCGTIAADCREPSMSQAETLSDRPRVSLSERAAKRIAEIVAGEPGTPLLRLSVEGGGCSGFSYKFDLVPVAEPDDIVIERDGARVLIDPVSLASSSSATVQGC